MRNECAVLFLFVQYPFLNACTVGTGAPSSTQTFSNTFQLQMSSNLRFFLLLTYYAFATIRFLSLSFFHGFELYVCLLQKSFGILLWVHRNNYFLPLARCIRHFITQFLHTYFPLYSKMTTHKNVKFMYSLSYY